MPPKTSVLTPVTTGNDASADFGQEFDAAAEIVWAAEFMIVIAGPNFDEGLNPTSSDSCDPQLVAQPNKLMGFWGSQFNDANERSPHDGYSTLARWRDRLFSTDDVRKKQGLKKPSGRPGNDDGDAAETLPKTLVVTSSVSGMFQRCGIPVDEIYETNGTVLNWQCAANPPCVPKVFTVDRGFRFHIDETTHEAPPIKYIADRRDLLAAERPVVALSDDEELDSIVNAGRDALEVSPISTKQLLPVNNRDDRLRKVLRRSERARVWRVSDASQGSAAEKFNDDHLFVGFASSRLPVVQSFTFADVASTLLPNPGAASQQHASVLIYGKTRNATVMEAIPNAELLAAQSCLPPKRLSHLYQHFMLIDNGFRRNEAGHFFITDPERYVRELNAFFNKVTQQQRASLLDIAAATVKRQAHITFNVSIAIKPGEPTTGETDDDRVALKHGVAVGSPVSAFRAPSLTRESVATASTSVTSQTTVPMLTSLLPVEVTKALLDTDFVPQKSQDAAFHAARQHLQKWTEHQWKPQRAAASVASDEDSRVAPPGSAATIDENHNCFFFSHVPIRVSQQEPIKNQMHDVITIQFPKAGPHCVRLPPTGGLLSLVCESAVGPEPVTAAKDIKPAAQKTITTSPQAGVASNPITYGGHMFQIAGSFPPHHVTASHPDVRNRDTKEVIELILETRKRYTVKIGVSNLICFTSSTLSSRCPGRKQFRRLEGFPCFQVCPRNQLRLERHLLLKPVRLGHLHFPQQKTHSDHWCHLPTTYSAAIATASLARTS